MVENYINRLIDVSTRNKPNTSPTLCHLLFIIFVFIFLVCFVFIQTILLEGCCYNNLLMVAVPYKRVHCAKMLRSSMCCLWINTDLKSNSIELSSAPILNSLL